MYFKQIEHNTKRPGFSSTKLNLTPMTPLQQKTIRVSLLDCHFREEQFSKLGERIIYREVRERLKCGSEWFGYSAAGAKKKNILAD